LLAVRNGVFRMANASLTPTDRAKPLNYTIGVVLGVGAGYGP
jgi:hypothetical protein